jgi:signal transduction histidine kinase
MKKNKFYWKSIIIIFGTNIFIYFFSKYIESGFHYLAIPFDDKIPFLPGFMYIYMIWYPFIMTILYFIYKYDKDKYLHTIIALVLSLVTTYFFFIFYPTAVVRPEVNSFHNVTTFVTYVVFKSDTPYNCFPSAHCLLCFLLSFSVFKDNKIPYFKLLNCFSYFVY